MKNAGKVFEADFKKSVPFYCFCYRLKDTAQSYNNSERTKFTWDNPCDFFIYDVTTHLFYALELKSTKFKSMAFGTEEDKDKFIKYHQLCSLREMSQYDGIRAGLILNFRDEETKTERTYFMPIGRFDNMVKAIGKKSFNEIDLIKNFAIKLNGEKKRIHYKWDLSNMLEV